MLPHGKHIQVDRSAALGTLNAAKRPLAVVDVKCHVFRHAGLCEHGGERIVLALQIYLVPGRAAEPASRVKAADVTGNSTVGIAAIVQPRTVVLACQLSVSYVIYSRRVRFAFLVVAQIVVVVQAYFGAASSPADVVTGLDYTFFFINIFFYAEVGVPVLSPNRPT